MTRLFLTLNKLAMVIMKVALVMLFVGPSANADEKDQAKAIYRILADQRERIRSMSVTVSIDGDEVIDWKEMYKWSNKVGVMNGTERFAMKGEKRYLEVLDAVGIGDRKLPRPFIDPAMPKAFKDSRRIQQRAYDILEREGHEIRNDRGQARKPFPEIRAYNGDVINTRLSESMGATSPKSRLKSLRNQFDPVYTHFLSFFVDDPTASEKVSKGRKKVRLHETLVRSPYKLYREVIEGRNCARLEAQMKVPSIASEGLTKITYWLDIDRGYSLVQREAVDVGSGELSSRLRTADPREVLPGIWFPWQCVREDFAPPYAPAAFRARPMAVTRLRVTECHMNDVPDGQFELSFEPSVLVSDFGLAERRNVDGPVLVGGAAGVDALDRGVDRGRRIIGSRRPWLIAIAMGAVTVVLLILILRHRRSRSEVE